MPAPMRDIPRQAVELIKSFEGIPDGDPRTVNLDAYLDPVGIWTIGWGHAVVFEGRHLKGLENKALARRLYPGGITRAQAEALLRADLLDRSPALLNLVRVPLADGEFGALLSFTFNAGAGRLASSTLLKLLNAGDRAGAADQFLLWNKSRNRNGVLIELPGLTRRRRAERAMFLGQDWRAAAEPKPATRGRPGVARRATRRVPAPQRPARPSAAEQRAAAKRSGAVKPPARTTKSKARPKAAPAKRRARRTAR